MKITIVGRLPSLNEVIDANRKSKFAGSSMKKKVQSRIVNCVRSQCKMKCKKISVSFEWYEQNKKRDFDNIASSTKFILDALVECGVIPNDGWKNVEPQLNHSFHHDKENPRIVVNITETEGIDGVQ